VLQKLGKTMETKDEHFELCSQNLNKQQMDGVRLFKDVKAYYSAVKAVHETSKRLSQTLRDVYEPDWDGLEDLAVITDSEDLLWNDFEEKINDQLVRTMENYTSQFPEVKERVAKRCRKLVDYDSARHHLEALQSAKKKDDTKISKAEEEFNKAQSVFEEINNELREELPGLYQSRIGCYVTIFQNISNLRDVFYKEMSVVRDNTCEFNPKCELINIFLDLQLNRDLYNVMKKLETQHSGKAFIVKGLNSAASKSKKKRSLVISNPIPCNTAFPADHVSIHSNGADGSSTSSQQSESVTEEQGKDSGSSTKDMNSSDSDLSSTGSNTPQRQSMCDHEDSDNSSGNHSITEAETGPESELSTKAPTTQELSEEAPAPSMDGSDAQSLSEDNGSDVPMEEVKPKPAPVPAPRLSFRRAERHPANPEMQEQLEQKDSPNPPDFLYKAVALESHAASEDGLLQFEEGDFILVLSGSQE
ncbi:hypothetical protein NL108_012075, partial [Boleophthalmus pectinirostris]